MSNERAKLLVWGKTPFLTLKTEKVEGDFDVEGLHEGAVYLQPVNGRKSKNGKPAFDQNSTTLPLARGYIKDNHIFFQPQNAITFHGTAFAFNRPKSEDDSTKIQEQTRLLAEWAKEGCVAVLDCTEHHQLKKLTDDFDGYFIKNDDILILTESTEFDKLPKNVQETYQEYVRRVKEEGENTDDLQDDLEGADGLLEQGLFLPVAQEGEKLCTTSMYKNIFSGEPLKENKPEGFIDLADFASNYTLPEKSQKQGSSGGGRRGGPSQVTPDQKKEFLTKVLDESGFSTNNLKEVVQQAITDQVSWYTLQLALSLASETTLPNNYPFVQQTFEQEIEEVKEEGNDEGEELSSVELLKQWCDEKVDDPTYSGQQLNKVHEVEIDEEKANLLNQLLNTYDITKASNKTKIEKLANTRLNKTNTVFDLDKESLKTVVESE